MNQGSQPDERLRQLIREDQARLQETGGLTGTPPVLRHAVNQNAIEIEDKQGPGRHGIRKKTEKLGR
ncbi:MAG: hypothetical protein DCF23_00100 [Cyanobium sp.]|nr:MAG: hypothetical protein DCF23_00100 [Cyanobium sp.]